MASKLFGLFDEKLRSQRDLVASEPQTLESISSDEGEQELILERVRRLETAEPRVDYSDFSNFVFFNSALDYFNITGEKILNEYPFDGSAGDIESFVADLDGFQRHVLKTWPSRTGYLQFQPAVSASYVKIDDSGVEGGISRTSFLNPGSGSLTLELWTRLTGSVTGTEDVMVLAQKVTGSSQEGYTAYLTGSSLTFRMKSGSTVDEVSVPLVDSRDTYIACVFDRTVASSYKLIIYSGTVGQFPAVASSASSTITGPLVLGGIPLYIGSGSLSGKVTRPFSGSIDEIRIWSSARTVADMSASYNGRINAQPQLLGMWRFNESGSIRGDDATNSVVIDSSGHRIGGKIQNYHWTVRASGSILPYDEPDPILIFDAPEVQSFISEWQTSGSDYDRDNENIITRLLPGKFFELEEFKGTTVLQDFLYIMGRQFDYLKVRIDQFVHVLRTNYTEFDQAPDALLAEVGRFFGWEFTGNFLNADAFQYMVGSGVLQNSESNRKLDRALYEIKNEFWRRVLINLMYLYKGKGTRESIESLLRLYGVNKNFVRVKEYGYKPNVAIQTHRIHAEKSVPALAFGSGSSLAVVSASISSSLFTSSFGVFGAIESRVRFPDQLSVGLTSSVATGSIWVIEASGSGPRYQLYYTKSVGTSQTGTLYLSGSEGAVVSMSNASIFDNRWYNIVCNRDWHSGTLSLNVRSLDVDTIDRNLSSSVSLTYPTYATTQSLALQVGATGSYRSEYWMQEVRVWADPLTDSEISDHTLNYQSYGTERSANVDLLALHWRLDEDVTGSATGELSRNPTDLSRNESSAGSQGFVAGMNPYKRFLNDYNYIAPPDYGWNEEKIRIIDDVKVQPSEVFNDDPRVALEFNMVDALNEDISQILVTMDSFNNSLGAPANRYRDDYPDLQKLRSQYFWRLQGQLSFRIFADMLEFFDRTFLDMVRKLLPARSIFVGDEFVVESHMLERPKLQWNYRRQDKQLVVEGRVRMVSRT